MPILSRIFRKNASAETRGQIPANTNARLLLDLAAFIDTLLAEDAYIARSRYLRRFEEARIANCRCISGSDYETKRRAFPA